MKKADKSRRKSPFYASDDVFFEENPFLLRDKAGNIIKLPHGSGKTRFFVKPNLMPMELRKADG